MQQENVTFLLDSEKKAAIDQIAASMECDRNALFNEAIQLYLEFNQWQVQEIQQGLAEADAEDFASDTEVEAVFRRLTDAN